MSGNMLDALRQPERATLDRHIDAVIDSGVIDVGDVAVKVRASAPAELIEAHLLALLRLAVRDRMSRRRAENPVLRGATATNRRPAGAPVTSAPTRGGRNARLREAWAAERARWLADSISVGDHRVVLGEATFADLIAAAGAMREQSARSLKIAHRYEQIAEVVSAAGVATVGDLPDDKLRELMARE